MKVYLDIKNFTKIYVDYTIRENDSVIAQDSIVATNNIIELPTYIDATYILVYYAENSFGKTDKYTWTFEYHDIEYPPKNITAEKQPGGTAVFVTWSSTGAEFYTLRVFDTITGNYTDYQVKDTSYIYKAASESETVSFAVSSQDSEKFSSATSPITVSVIPDYSDSVTPPPAPSLVPALVGYNHTTKQVIIKVSITHGDRSDVMGTVVRVQPEGSSEWITETIYKPSDEAIFTLDWNDPNVDNNMAVSIQGESFSSNGGISTTTNTSLDVAKYSYSYTAPTLTVTAGSFDTVNVSWDAVISEAPVEYVLQYDTVDTFDSPVEIITSNTSETIKLGLTGTVYFRIKVRDVWGNESGWSTTAQASNLISFDEWDSSYQEQVSKLETTLSSNFINSLFKDENGNASLLGWTTAPIVSFPEVAFGSGSVENVAGSGAYGDFAIQNSASTEWLLYSNKVPIESTNTYRVECFARTVSGSTGTFTLAVVLFDDQDNVITGDGEWWYYPENGIVPPAEWTFYSAVFGYGTAHPFPSNAKKMAVGLRMNEGSGDRLFQIQLPTIRLMMDRVYIRQLDGSDIRAKSIQTQQLAAEAVTADKLSATLEMFIGQVLKVGGKIEVYRDATTGEGKIIVKDSSNNEIIKIGENVLTSGGNGIYSLGAIEIADASGSKTILDSSGIRQIYSISVVDQLDSSKTLQIPIYIPENASSSGVKTGKARIIVKAEKFRAYAKANYASGIHAHQIDLTHSHVISPNWTKFTTDPGGSDNHTHDYDVANGWEIVSWGSLTTTTSGGAHTHTIQFGIYEATNSATITVKQNTTTIGTVSTGNKGDWQDIDISDGDVIELLSDDLARVSVFVFVEYLMNA